jgi:glycine cleavage system H protein
MGEILGYNMPEELYYQAEHSWARVESDGTVTVGMDDFFQKEAGDIVFVDLPSEEDEVEQGEVCGKIQSRKWIGKLCAPVSGEISAVNESLQDDFSLINSDSYASGWVIKIKPSNLDEDLENLYHGDKIQEWMKAEVKRAEDEKAKAG